MVQSLAPMDDPVPFSPRMMEWFPEQFSAETWEAGTEEVMSMVRTVAPGWVRPIGFTMQQCFAVIGNCGMSLTKSISGNLIPLSR